MVALFLYLKFMDWTITVCVASGPSLTADDCEIVRQSGLPVIVTNCSWRLCPWADALYAMDRKWWEVYGHQAMAEFPGRKICGVRGGHDAEYIAFKHGRNSGAGAISLAAKWGARRIILLGYDCQRTGGRRHWHGDHPVGMGNTQKLRYWPAEFKVLSLRMAKEGRQVINCTRETALNCFPRMKLQESLCQPVAGMGIEPERTTVGATPVPGRCQESHL